MNERAGIHLKLTPTLAGPLLIEAVSELGAATHQQLESDLLFVDGHAALFNPRC